MQNIIKKIIVHGKMVNLTQIRDLDPALLMKSIKLSPNEDILDPYPYQHMDLYLDIKVKVWNDIVIILHKGSVESTHPIRHNRFTYITIVKVLNNGKFGIFRISGCYTYRVGDEDFGHLKFYGELNKKINHNINARHITFYKIKSTQLMQDIGNNITEKDHNYLKCVFGCKESKYIMLIYDRYYIDINLSKDRKKLHIIQLFIMESRYEMIPFHIMKETFLKLLLTKI